MVMHEVHRQHQFGRYREQESFTIVARFEIPCGEKACTFVLAVRIRDAFDACAVERHTVKRGPGLKLVYG
jgi:hypothetical protein